ncbi:APC family permease [Williamsoniiplasma lucivorax]|uniref:Amino acid permease n=1 Tax=Williamsoniiplasma lucivorax TaxID=209274 RepID=A0A2S5RFB0_9MOLU|nr:APC family permease [Williamsoniiplasma lucivorax]PPE06004.1 amino acid permease [Williamsoniiplasma lucivorax]
MLKNKAKFYEFLSLFIMTVGTVIGSGIFMKNTQLLQSTENPIIAIILWTAVGLVAIMIVYVFIEISSATTHMGNGTVGTWTKMFINRRTASLFSVFYTTLYYPICQSLFAGAFVGFFFQTIGKPLDADTQLIILLATGIFLIVFFNTISMLKPSLSRHIQVFGTIFKFIPLLIALGAGFFLMNTGSSAFLNGGYGGHDWSTSNFVGANFIKGFGPILFAFDGFIYITNAQKRAKFKEVVPKSLLFGLVFVAIFYVLISISLFMGSPDGSIVELLSKLFSLSGSASAATAANIISNIFLMGICLIGVNIFAMIGNIGLESDVDAKIVYTHNKGMSTVHAGIVNTILSIIFFVALTLAGTMFIRGNWTGLGTTFESWTAADPKNVNLKDYLSMVNNNMLAFINTMSTAISTFCFLMVGMVMIASIFNRKTNKVAVEKIKGFIPLAIFGSILLIFFVICGVITFALPESGKAWIGSDGFYFTILFGGSFIFAILIFALQEFLFYKIPITNGFHGFHSDHKKGVAHVKQ